MVIDLHDYIPRLIEKELNRALARSPAVAILGPRQCGKTTTAKLLLKGTSSVYLDLQDRVDRNKLSEPELFFDAYRDRLICLDEIQLLPDFFPILRSEIDKERRPGRFLILGSASRDMIGQSSESLAGRISYLRTSNGAEIDLMLERAGRRHLFECKLSKAPKPSRGFYELAGIMKPESAWVIAPVDAIYEIKKRIVVCPLEQLKLA